MDQSGADHFAKLCEIVAKLRAPGGCPWDREQTHDSLLLPLIEEAYEIAGALRAKDDANFREELGDLLLLIVMHAEIAREAGRFNIDNVLADVTKKLIRRHPHVFGKSDARDSGAVLKQWEDVIAKIEEELGDLKQAVASKGRSGRGRIHSKSDQAIGDEIGDLLFAVVN